MKGTLSLFEEGSTKERAKKPSVFFVLAAQNETLFRENIQNSIKLLRPSTDRKVVAWCQFDQKKDKEKKEQTKETHLAHSSHPNHPLSVAPQFGLRHWRWKVQWQYLEFPQEPRAKHDLIENQTNKKQTRDYLILLSIWKPSSLPTQWIYLSQCQKREGVKNLCTTQSSHKYQLFMEEVFSGLFLSRTNLGLQMTVSLSLL